MWLFTSQSFLSIVDKGYPSGKCDGVTDNPECHLCRFKVESQVQ
jgi:hypothetical protein